MNDNDSDQQHRTLMGRVADLYIDGFRNMTVGRTLWVLIILKIILLVFVFKLIFFPDMLQRDYDTNADRAQAVRSSLTDEARQSENNN